MRKPHIDRWQIQIFLTIAILVLSGVSLYYACQSTKYSKESVEWVTKPKPLLKIFPDKTVTDEIQKNGYYNIPLNPYSPTIGMDSFKNYCSCRKIEIYLYNAGRIPVINPTILIEIKSNESGYPFRLWKVKTDVSSFLYNISNHTIKWNSKYIYPFNSHKVPDLIPNDMVNWLPPFSLSTINKGELNSFEIWLLGVKEGAKGILKINIIAENVSESLDIPIYIGPA